MIANDVPILAVRTCYEDGALLIPMLGDLVGGAMLARLAGECELVAGGIWRNRVGGGSDCGD